MPQDKTFAYPIRTRLVDSDMQRFKKFVEQRATNEAQFTRDAILFYMDSLDKGTANQIESIYSKQLKASTNRICALLSKVATDMRALYFYVGDEQPEVMFKCRTRARQQISKALTVDEIQISDQMSAMVMGTAKDADNPNNPQA